MSLSRNHVEEGTRNIFGLHMQFTSKHTTFCLDNCHVTLKTYLLCLCLDRFFCFQRSLWTSKHRSVRLFRDSVSIGSMTVSILRRQASYKSSPVRFYIRVRRTHSHGNVINYKDCSRSSSWTR